MKFSGEYHFAVPADRVFAAVTDPNRFQRAIDGCPPIESKGNDVYEVHPQLHAMGLRVNPVISVTVTDRKPPTACRFLIAGKSSFGSLGGTINIQILPDASGSLLHYDAEGSLTGWLTSIAPRLIEVNVTRALAEFFEKLDRQFAETRPD